MSKSDSLCSGNLLDSGSSEVSKRRLARPIAGQAISPANTNANGQRVWVPPCGTGVIEASLLDDQTFAVGRFFEQMTLEKMGTLNNGTMEHD